MATGNVPITAGSGTPIRIITNPGVDSGANQQVMTLGGPDGTLAPTDPDGTLQVSPEARSLLLDDFGAQAITIFWAVASGNSGTTPAASGGNVPVSAGTASGGYAVARTQFAHRLQAATYLRIAHIVAIEATATANNSRWWGYGSNQTTPTATAPVLNGAVFLLDSANSGALTAAIFSNGTKTTVATLTRPSDGLQHRYELYYRQSRIDWLIDGAVVATRLFPNLAIATGLYGIFGSANAAAVTAPTFTLSSYSAGDQGSNNGTISDGTNPSILAVVKAGNSPAAANDQALVVAVHPTSPLPTGTNQIGWVNVGGTTPASSFVISTTTNTATVVKSGSGNLYSLLLSNTSTTAQYVKLFNATSVTLGTTVAVADILVPASSTSALTLGTNGLRFTTGIAHAVTGAAGTTNNTAGAGGVTIAASYV